MADDYQIQSDIAHIRVLLNDGLVRVPIAVPVPQMGLLPTLDGSAAGSGATIKWSTPIPLYTLGGMAGTDLRRIRAKATTIPAGRTLSFHVRYFSSYEAAVAADDGAATLDESVDNIIQLTPAALLDWYAVPIDHQFYPYMKIGMALDANEAYSGVSVHLAYIGYAGMEG